MKAKRINHGLPACTVQTENIATVLGRLLTITVGPLQLNVSPNEQ
jgi:hypothetical protein